MVFHFPNVDDVDCFVALGCGDLPGFLKMCYTEDCKDKLVVPSLLVKLLKDNCGDVD